MGNLFGSDFMDFMVYKDIRQKRELGETSGEDIYFEGCGNSYRKTDITFSDIYPSRDIGIYPSKDYYTGREGE